MESSSPQKPVFAIWSMVVGFSALTISLLALLRPVRGEEGLGHLISSVFMGTAAVDVSMISWSILASKSRRRCERVSRYPIAGLIALILAMLTCVALFFPNGLIEGVKINAICIGPAVFIAGIIFFGGWETDTAA